jgi:phosphoribosylanthranilate isomerase
VIKIKICGLFREEDAAYASEAKPDYAGFVFAESRRQVSPALAARLRGLLDGAIVPVGVFVNAPPGDIIALYRDGIIDIVQLHGDEDAAYMARLKEASAKDGRGAAPLIKAFSASEVSGLSACPVPGGADYYLIDSGRGGTGKSFDWGLIKGLRSSPELRSGPDLRSGPELRGSPERASPLGSRPWFLAGGIGLHNIKEAMALEPFGIDVSSGAETGGLKDREKMLGLTRMVRKGSAL